jgi:hypothetical protein
MHAFVVILQGMDDASLAKYNIVYCTYHRPIVVFDTNEMRTLRLLMGRHLPHT